MKSLALGLILLTTTAWAAQVPRKAPEFVIQQPDGKQLLLSQYRGKVVVLEFGYTTCPHCQVASQLMNRLQTEYGPKGYQSLAVFFNPMSKMLVPDFVRQFRVAYPVGYSEREPVVDFLQIPREQNLHVPQVVILDRKGMIRQQSQQREDATVATEQNLRRMVETLLAEPGGPVSKKAAPAKRAAAAKKTS